MRILPKPINVPALLELLANELRDAQPVLIIDGDRVFLRTLSDLLGLHGFETVAANSLKHARDLMAERRPVAILLHAHLDDLPTRDAVAVLHAGAPSTALILYSGRPDTHEHMGNIPGDWVRAYLQKPFDVAQVTGVLDAVRHVG